MVANEGYLAGKVNFSCRVARCAKGRDTPVDIIQSLRAYASLDPESSRGKGEEAETGAAEPPANPPLLERLGDNFARGHVQASGGIVDVAEFEELMRLMRVGEKAEKKDGGGQTSPKKRAKKTTTEAKQKNTLMNYFGKE